MVVGHFFGREGSCCCGLLGDEGPYIQLLQKL